MATSNDTINDPLRRVAGEDAVTFAFLNLSRKHAQDPAYLETLNKAVVEYRRETASQQVKDHEAQGKTGDALKVLKTHMDPAADPAESSKIFEAAGKPVFTRDYFDGRLNDLLGDKN